MPVPVWNNDNIFLAIYNCLYSAYGPQRWWPARSRLEVIVGAVLTQNTSWKNVESALGNIKKHDLLSVEKIHGTGVSALAPIVRSAGCYNVKARRLKNFIDFLMREYGGSLSAMFKVSTPILRRQLLEINGLGEETVDCILLYGGRRPVFVVDAYTRRIFFRHGLIAEQAVYADIQKKCMDALPPDSALFNEYHALIVALGKTRCGKQPRCSGCPMQGVNKRCSDV